MRVVGVTGPTGAGKTTALEVLGELGFETVDCDALYGELLRADGDLRRDLRAAFGEVFLPDGGLDRPALAARVFSDGRELERLNAIVYPAVRRAVEERIGSCGRPGAAVDAVNLLPSGLGALCDVTIAVTAPEDLRLRRIMDRDGLSEAAARARLAAQRPSDWYRARCTAALENRFSDPEDFRRAVRKLCESLGLFAK